MNELPGKESSGAAASILLREKLPVYQILTEEQRAILESCFSFRQISAGEKLWHEGEIGRYLAFVLSGCVHMKKDTEFGGKPIVVGVFSAGSVIGELTFSGNEARGLTASATDSCELAVLTRSRFEALVKEHPAVGVQLLDAVLKATCRRLEKSYERLAAIF